MTPWNVLGELARTIRVVPMDLSNGNLNLVKSTASMSPEEALESVTLF